MGFQSMSPASVSSRHCTGVMKQPARSDGSQKRVCSSGTWERESQETAEPAVTSSKLTEAFLPHLRWSHIQTKMWMYVSTGAGWSPIWCLNSEVRQSAGKKKPNLTRETLSSFVCSSFHPRADSRLKVVFSSVLSWIGRTRAWFPLRTL